MPYAPPTEEKIEIPSAAEPPAKVVNIMRNWLRKNSRKLGLSLEQVASAVEDGGHNGIRVQVSDEGRRALAPYKRQSDGGSSTALRQP
jgi:hypothetical protein